MPTDVGVLTSMITPAVRIFEDRLALTFTQLDWLTSRARHLSRSASLERCR
jgi:hypothetical protein